MSTVALPRPKKQPIAVEASSPHKKARKFNLPGLLFAVGCIIVIEILARAGLLTSYVPPPSAMFVALVRGLADGDISSQVGVTLLVYAEGLALATTLAVVLGILMGTYRRVFEAFRIIVEFMRPVPSVAMIPIAILFLGLGTEMRLSIVTYAAFWPLLISTLYGVRGIDPLALDVARNFGITGTEALRRVTLPSALTGIMTGFRVSSSIALVVTVTVELVAGNSGIGFYISQMEQADQLPPMYAAIVLTGILGYLLNMMCLQIDRRIVFWTPSQQESVNALPLTI
jgi:ABC-type nitrate/sulfonate/bicarbonate transport system permease component